jgi:hypothetical protein
MIPEQPTPRHVRPYAIGSVVIVHICGESTYALAGVYCGRTSDKGICGSGAIELQGVISLTGLAPGCEDRALPEARSVRIPDVSIAYVEPYEGKPLTAWTVEQT